MRTTIMLLAASTGLAALTPSPTQAACGSAFCTVNTDWNVQGVYVEPGARAELRYEYLNQDQPRAGSKSVEVGEIPAHHDEVSTLNQALFATFDYNWASGWGVSAIIPVIKREHEHIHNHQGVPIPEEWDFTGLGDIRVAGRYQFKIGAADPAKAQTVGLLFGLKLPTGDTDVTNDDGDPAERSLQPGTGTTDPFAGAYYQIQLPARGLSFFAQGAYAAPLDSYHEYKPGDRLTVDLGMRYEATPHLALLLQFNGLWRGRDSGAQAEPEDSGGQYFFISPGLSVLVTPKVQLFALVQLPIYQYVNGVQLTASWGATAGVGVRF
jgi:hypothetical protein